MMEDDLPSRCCRPPPPAATASVQQEGDALAAGPPPVGGPGGRRQAGWAPGVQNGLRVHTAVPTPRRSRQPKGRGGRALTGGCPCTGPAAGRPTSDRGLCSSTRRCGVGLRCGWPPPLGVGDTRNGGARPPVNSPPYPRGSHASCEVASRGGGSPPAVGASPLKWRVVLLSLLSLSGGGVCRRWRVSLSLSYRPLASGNRQKKTNKSNQKKKKPESEVRQLREVTNLHAE